MLRLPYMVRHPSLSSALFLFSLAVIPSSLLLPPPFLAYFRSAPAVPSPPTYSSLSTARPTHIRSPVVFLLAWCLRYSTLFLVVSRFLHLLTSRLLMASPPPPHPPFFHLSLFQVGFFLMVPGWVWVSRLLLGLPLPWLTQWLCVYCSLSLSCSCSYLRLASLSPASPPPFRLALLGATADPLLLAASRFSGCYTCLS